MENFINFYFASSLVCSFLPENLVNVKILLKDILCSLFKQFFGEITFIMYAVFIHATIMVTNDTIHELYANNTSFFNINKN